MKKTPPKPVKQRVDQKKLLSIGRQLLIAIGQNPSDPRIKDTPARFARWWKEFIEYDAGKVKTAFETNHTDQLVVVSGMRVWSLCEHHLLPFYCYISIGYIPAGKVLGLSKFGRIAHACAHKIQIQERMVQEIADRVRELAGTEDVAVLGQGEHLCMTMRGIKTEGLMTSSVTYGAFRKEIATRAEFMHIARRSK